MEEMGKLEKIVLIGPVYPYKGGIAHYTGLLYRALAEKYDVTMISYSFQYPKLLYKKEQKDYSNDTFNIKGTRFLINTANPINWLNVSHQIAELSPDLVIIQWWHPYFAPCYRQIIRGIKRGCDAKVLFTCHNVFPHERFPMDRVLTKNTLRKGDFFIVQSKQDEEDLKSIIPNAVYKRAVHPTYNVFKMRNMTKEEARELICIEETEKVLLFFGFVRKYKGLEYLLRAMPLICGKRRKMAAAKQIAEYRLLVVGDFGDDKAEYINFIKELGIEDVVDIHDGYIPDKEVEKYFAACDVVVLPYVSATQSGIVQIAYGFDKPVIATDVGGLPDVVINGKTGILTEPENPEAIAGAVETFFTGDNPNLFQTGVREENYRFSWERMVTHIEELYSL